MSATSVPALRGFTARGVMHGPVAAVDPSAELAELAAVMSSKRIHCVVVDGITRDARGEHLVWGVVSDLDLVRAALDDTPGMTAGRIAATEAICVDADADLESVAALLVANEASHVLVVEDERPVGVVSTFDVAGVLGR